jgi:predicted AAA+ superfamily ATPase
MIQRTAEARIRHLLDGFPCVGLIGPRQVGKTTLAKEIGKSYERVIYLDLELNADLVKLEDAETYLRQFHDHLIIIDEVQRKPDLFPALRALIDQDRRPGRFILLGPASPSLLKNASESLAGRIAYQQLGGFSIPEIPPETEINSLWLRGGFPDAFLKPDFWQDWMENFVLTYLERDLPSLGFPANRTTGRHLWSMMAHYHGNLLNFTELSKSLEMSATTVKRYISFLEEAFLLRILEPWHANPGKRIVKTPKVYLRDSGILHYFLGVQTLDELFGHPKKGASWEGFVIGQILQQLPASQQAFFYRSHDGAETDLVIVQGGKPAASVEIKFGSAARPSRGNTESVKALKTESNFILVSGNEDYLLSSGFRVCGIRLFLDRYLQTL